jgi:SNF2 family DNA or RNA helicase
MRWQRSERAPASRHGARTAIAEFKELSRIPPVPSPEGLTATLRHYQEDGLSWLWFLHRHGLSGILADDMGLGKTVQALALLQQVRNVEGSAPSLVVAPTSVLPNWQREAERFTPGLRVAVWHGQDRRERVEDLAGADMVLTSYALARRDRDELLRTRWRYVLLDEAQNIKNAGSATAQACKALPADHRLALTGTPLENRLSELWSIFDFLMPGFLGAEEDFAERYEQPIEVGADLGARERLRRRVQPFLLRRLKTEVARDLPPKTETVAYCEMEPAQAALYREVLEESRAKVQESIQKVGFKRARVSILAALLRLRQVCNDPRLLKLPGTALLPPSAKLQRFDELVDDLLAEGHRALVFSQFTEMLRLLEAHATERKVAFLSLDGRTRDRMSRVDAFNREDGPPIFFISLKAGGTGLNLTAADYVIHYDPWWNPAVEDQATDRTHRIGQTRAVIAYKLITRGTVEEKILALQQRKRELAQGILGPGGALSEGLTEQDVETLFAED